MMKQKYQKRKLRNFYINDFLIQNYRYILIKYILKIKKNLILKAPII